MQLLPPLSHASGSFTPAARAVAPSRSITSSRVLSRTCVLLCSATRNAPPLRRSTSNGAHVYLSPSRLQPTHCHRSLKIYIREFDGSFREIGRVKSNLHATSLTSRPSPRPPPRVSHLPRNVSSCLHYSIFSIFVFNCRVHRCGFLNCSSVKASCVVLLDWILRNWEYTVSIVSFIRSVRTWRALAVCQESGLNYPQISRIRFKQMFDCF